MTKKDLIEVVAKKANLTNKAARDAVQTTLNTIRDSLKRGEKVVLTGFGTFSMRTRQQRVGRNPKTGASVSCQIISGRNWCNYMNIALMSCQPKKYYIRLMAMYQLCLTLLNIYMTRVLLLLMILSKYHFLKISFLKTL